VAQSSTRYPIRHPPVRHQHPQRARAWSSYNSVFLDSANCRPDYLTRHDAEGLFNRRGIIQLAAFDHSFDLVDIANVLRRVAVD